MAPEEDDLFDLLQFGSWEVKKLREILEANENDPAYLLGIVAQALIGLSPEKHTLDEEKLQLGRELHEMLIDVLRLKRAWFDRYPRLEAMYEERMTPEPEHVV